MKDYTVVGPNLEQTNFNFYFKYRIVIIYKIKC